MSTDPTALAREVLDTYAAWGKTAAGSDECTRATEAFTDAVNRGGLNLARAVIAVAALADQLDAEGDQLQHTSRLPDVPAGMERQAAAARVRTALNGDDK